MLLIKKIKPALFALIPALLLLTLFSNSGCISYLYQAGRGQLSLLWNSRALDEVKADPTISEEVKLKLEHIEKVKLYAQKHLALTPKETFTTYTEIDRSAVAWNVSACEELSFTPKTWWFPIVGRVPYLGFFSKEEAIKLQNQLNNEGWDTLLRPVSAYSTLGWFNDPILSTQMKYPEWYLTSLVIHESVHSTVWINSSVQFNESLASYIERKGTIQFYSDLYGEKSDIVKKIKKYSAEQKAIQQIFRETALKLDKIYKNQSNYDTKHKHKANILYNLNRELIDSKKSFKVLKIERYLNYDFNNAFLMSYRRYHSGEKFFDRIYKESAGNWAVFMHKIKKLNEVKHKEIIQILSE